MVTKKRDDIIRFDEPKRALRYIRRTLLDSPPTDGFVVGEWIDKRGVKKYKFKFFNPVDKHWQEVSVHAASVDLI